MVTVQGYDRKKWWPISRQIYADVAKNGKPDRIDTFNGNYGLTRGLTASGLVLACIAFSQGQCSVMAGAEPKIELLAGHWPPPYPGFLSIARASTRHAGAKRETG